MAIIRIKKLILMYYIDEKDKSGCRMTFMPKTDATKEDLLLWLDKLENKKK